MKKDKDCHHAFNIWDGVFEKFSDVKNSHENIFNQDQHWTKNLCHKLENTLAHIDTPEFISYASLTNDYPLPLVIAMLAADKDVIRVLDFGGGIGIDYLKAMSSLPYPDKLEFHIVENEEIIKKARHYFNQFKKINFYQQLPTANTLSKVDCIHLGSSLQYIEDWQALFKQLATYQAPYIILSDLLAGDIPSYITSQYYYGKKIPVRFLNIKEFIHYLGSLGYHLFYKSLYQAKILDQEGPLPQANLPEQYRLDYACHLLFKKKVKNNEK